jgi:hypothetical protein
LLGVNSKIPINRIGYIDCDGFHIFKDILARKSVNRKFFATPPRFAIRYRPSADLIFPFSAFSWLLLVVRETRDFNNFAVNDFAYFCQS